MLFVPHFTWLGAVNGSFIIIKPKPVGKKLYGLHFIILYSTKVVYFCIYYCTLFHNPEISGASVIPISEVHISTAFLLLTMGN